MMANQAADPRNNILPHRSFLTRREWLAASACWVLPGLAATARPIERADGSDANAGEPGIPCRLAVKYHMIQAGETPLQKLQIASRAGFDGVELSIRDVSSAKALRAASQQTGVIIHGVSHGTDEDFAPPIELCHAVGGDAVLVIAKEHTGLNYEENFAHSQQVMRRYLPLAERLGVRLLVENVRASFLKQAEEMARFLDSLDSPQVGAYFDTGNAITWTKQPAEHWAQVLGNRIIKLDIKDRGHNTFGDPKLKRPTVVGTDGGEVHWRNVRQQLRELRFQGWATAEVSGGDEPRLRKMSAWMRHVLRIG